MTLVDVAWLVIIGVSALISVLRGFVREVFSLIAWVLALVVAARLGGPLAEGLAGTIDDSQVRAVTAFLLLFFATLLVASLVGVGAYRLVHSSGLKGTDRSLGLFFGLLRGVVVVGIVVLVIRGTPFRDATPYETAFLRPGFDPVANFIHRLLPEDYGEYFQNQVLPMDALKQGAEKAGDTAREAGKEMMDREGLESVIRKSLENND
jgi:membrane protein required for colicin V production